MSKKEKTIEIEPFKIKSKSKRYIKINKLRELRKLAKIPEEEMTQEDLMKIFYLINEEKEPFTNMLNKKVWIVGHSLEAIYRVEGYWHL